MTASLVEKSDHAGSEFHIFAPCDFENAILSRSILEQGWRIVAVYEVMVLMYESESVNGVSTTRNVLRPEARFLCVRGERGDLVEGLQRRLEALAQEMLETKKKGVEVTRERDVLTTKVRQLEDRLSALDENYKALRESENQAHRRFQEAQRHHQKLETHFGAVRAAIGEIALKQILDTADPKVPKVT